ncbi:MAG: branched-chain amino acid aminotransferase [Tropheryma whipplei]|uniref:branched-chain amino acid aminotransferase n=1 Tax=Tropheryma whipplei TaxID=2039 RepID=UPI000000C8AE|nr:branched-chain amino acid aminotransferase [Tropheryma whipplei]MCO8183037.1 branched-chain amino acid aminotransferase [Tropheryma whipplei]CAD67230.1 branched-chain amino acid aminotransferase [Tropheryma whipplei TW08/27]
MSAKNYKKTLLVNPISQDELQKRLSAPGFGSVFSEHMVSADWHRDLGWHDYRVEPYGPISLAPSAMVFHYGQEIFEGLKIFRHSQDSSVRAFRPLENAKRFQKSSERIALPVLPVEDFLQSLREWVMVDGRWVPNAPSCVYARPFMIATEEALGLRATCSARYTLICCPVGDLFGQIRPIKVRVSSKYSRASRGGTGSVKFGGNYAASILPQVEAGNNGFDQVLFLDSASYKNIEELSASNIFFVLSSKTLITPSLDGTILPGVTRDSIIRIAEDLGFVVEQRQISLDEVTHLFSQDKVTEMFCCGTAASVTPIGSVSFDGGTLGSGQAGPVTMLLREYLRDIQFGNRPDKYNWMVNLEDT